MSLMISLRVLVKSVLLELAMIFSFSCTIVGGAGRTGSTGAFLCFGAGLDDTFLRLVFFSGWAAVLAAAPASGLLSASFLAIFAFALTSGIAACSASTDAAA